MQEAELEEWEKRALDDESVAANQYVDHKIEKCQISSGQGGKCCREADRQGRKEMSVEEDRAPDSITEKREKEGEGGIGEGEEANRGRSLDLDKRVAVEPGHEESIKTAGLKNEDERAGLINSDRKMLQWMDVIARRVATRNWLPKTSAR